MRKEEVIGAIANEEKTKLIHGFCDPKCIFHEEREIPSYTEPSHKTTIDICNFGGSARSFGCMGGCLNGKPEYAMENNIEINN